jgi:hypothetical protein
METWFANLRIGAYNANIDKKLSIRFAKKPWHQWQFGAQLQTAKPFRALHGMAIDS